MSEENVIEIRFPEKLGNMAPEQCPGMVQKGSWDQFHPLVSATYPYDIVEYTRYRELSYFARQYQDVTRAYAYQVPWKNVEHCRIVTRQEADPRAQPYCSPGVVPLYVINYSVSSGLAWKYDAYLSMRKHLTGAHLAVTVLPIINNGRIVYEKTERTVAAEGYAYRMSYQTQDLCHTMEEIEHLDVLGFRDLNAGNAVRFAIKDIYAKLVAQGLAAQEEAYIVDSFLVPFCQAYRRGGMSPCLGEIQRVVEKICDMRIRSEFHDFVSNRLPEVARPPLPDGPLYYFDTGVFDIRFAPYRMYKER